MVADKMMTLHPAVVVMLIIICCHCASFNEVNYSYKYSIEQANYGLVSHHWETRTGNHAKGGYSFLDADGRVRVVEYAVDGNRGFEAYVSFRKPFTELRLGHLQYPNQYRIPVRLATPVSLITPDLFRAPRTYPNFF